ncbi:MAG: hypothetical protein JW793_09845 [Acidobacteria bacterium]|nr:hypothetical protein [Acidobacteriota bacterium]
MSRFVACKAHYLARGFLAGSDRYILCGYGSTGRSLFRALADLGKRPSHIVEVKPSRVGKRIHGAPVIPPGVLPRIEAQPIIVSVARATLGALGFIETKDYVCAA